MKHIPVLLNEIIKTLDPKPGQKFIDATVGMGGHAKELLKAGVKVLGIDQDPSVIATLSEAEGEAISEIAASPQASRNDKLVLAQGNFSEIQKIAEENGFTEVDGILFDLGLGSHQLDDADRGFSFQKEGPLDMRFNASVPRHSESAVSGLRMTRSFGLRPQDDNVRTASDVVNFYSEKDLLRIFYQFGEERRFGKRIARTILEKRKTGTIQTTAELFDLIKQALPGKFRFKAGDAARRIFQALRIEVNDELGNLEKGLSQAIDLVRRGGRLVAISFHSLEDRMVKNFFVKESKDCVCPAYFPECVCSARARLRILTKKPVTATPEEVETNSRSKGAKMRAAERI